MPAPPHRLALALLATVAAYVLVLTFLSALFLPPLPAGHMAAMAGAFQASQTALTLNIASLLLAAVFGAFVHASLPLPPSALAQAERQGIKRALSPDEARLLEEVERSGSITQDSLRFRLGWSKAKVSTVLANLDRADIVQRERLGKTYTVRPAPGPAARQRSSPRAPAHDAAAGD